MGTKLICVVLATEESWNHFIRLTSYYGQKRYSSFEICAASCPTVRAAILKKILTILVAADSSEVAILRLVYAHKQQAEEM